MARAVHNLIITRAARFSFLGLPLAFLLALGTATLVPSSKLGIDVLKVGVRLDVLALVVAVAVVASRTSKFVLHLRSTGVTVVC